MNRSKSDTNILKHKTEEDDTPMIIHTRTNQELSRILVR